MSDAVFPSLEHATRVRDHWWWRPGWRVGRRFYTWHLMFADQPELHTLVATYQRPLAALPGLDLVPRPWLHLTMQGVGFTDEIADDEIERIVAAARARLAALPVADLTFHRLLVRSEAIVLPTTPMETVVAIRNAIRAAIAAARSIETGEVPEADAAFLPHVTVAYANRDTSAEPLRAALTELEPSPATVRVRAASLIMLDRDHRMYRWRECHTVPFGG